MPQRKELRELLLDAIEQVKDGSLEPDKAAAVADLSQAVINADRFQLEAMEFAARCKTDGLEFKAPALIEHQTTDDDEEIEDEIDEDEAEDDEPEPEPDPPKKSKSVAPALNQQRLTAVTACVKRDQPADLDDIAGATKIPKAELFQLLKDERFERDTDGFYWIAK